MYFDGVIVLDKETGAPYYLHVVSSDYVRDSPDISDECFEDGSLLARHWYGRVGLAGDPAPTYRILTPEKLAENFVLSKFELGWMNYPEGAYYLLSSSERSVRKCHRADRIRAESLYMSVLRSYYDKLLIQHDREDTDRESLDKRLRAVHESLRKFEPARKVGGYFVSQVNGTLGNPFYPELGEGLSTILGKKPKVASVALSREFALSLCNEFHTTSCGLYFHRKVVGFVDEQCPKVFKSMSGINPHLRRSFGIEGELV